MDTLKTLLDRLDAGGSWGWTVPLFAVVLFTVVAATVKRRLMGRLKAGMARTENPWDDALVSALDAPTTMLIWVLGIGFGVYTSQQRTGSHLFDNLRPIIVGLVLASFIWFVLRLVREMEAVLVRLEDDEGSLRWDQTTVDALGKLLRLSVIITGTLVVLDSMGLDVTGIIAFGGIGGMAVASPPRTCWPTSLGALMIYLDRPIAVGDWVRSPDRAIEGTVESIGWRLTRIRTFDQRPLYVPNQVFTTIAVENPSRMQHRRIYEKVGLRYDDVDQLDAVLDGLRKVMREHPGLDSDETQLVAFEGFGESSLDLMLYCFTETTAWAEYLRVKDALLLKVAQLVRAHGAEFAFPTRTLEIPKGVSLAGDEAPPGTQAQ